MLRTRRAGVAPARRPFTYEFARWRLTLAGRRRRTVPGTHGRLAQWLALARGKAVALGRVTDDFTLGTRVAGALIRRTLDPTRRRTVGVPLECLAEFGRRRALYLAPGFGTGRPTVGRTDGVVARPPTFGVTSGPGPLIDYRRRGRRLRR